MKYRSYYNDTFIAEFTAHTDAMALLIANNVEPYPTKVVRVEGDKEVEIRPLG